MADSDDDSEHRMSRDKFRRERSDYDRRDKREPFEERVAGGGGGYTNNRSRPDSRSERRGPNDYRSFVGARDRPQPFSDPLNKRPRRDWNDETRSSYRQRENRPNNADEEVHYRPPLMPFKRFLDPLDDLITDEEALRKYKEYKTSFNKQYIEEFFEAHKDEEWLREKYHPNYIDNSRETIAKNIRHRLDVFLDLFDKGMVDNQSVQVDNSDKLIKLIDAVVIKLSGGTDEDLTVLDETGHESDDENASVRDKFKSPSNKVARSNRLSGNKSEEGEDSDFDSDDGDERKPKPTSAHLNKIADNVDALRSSQCAQSSNESVSNSESEDEADKAEDKVETTDEIPNNNKSGDGGDALSKQNESQGDKKIKSLNGQQPKEVEEYIVPVVVRPLEEEDEDIPTPTTAEAPGDGGSDQVLAESTVTPTAAIFGLQHKRSKRQQEPSNFTQNGKPPMPRKLHKTASIFFRGLPPTISRKELTELCASQPGFLRLAIYDPMPERRFTRHAWATYKPDVNVKKICWALNTSSMLREKWYPENSNSRTTSGNNSSNELCATVNRDLAQRIRPVTPITRHKRIMRNDLIIASRLISQLDEKHNLWPLTNSADEEGEEEQAVVTCPVPGLQDVFSANPLMRNLTDYLIDESGAEEAMLVSGNEVPYDKPSEEVEEEDRAGMAKPIETDALLARALDRLLIYLRIVYSIDYYSATMYQLEDMMPHRCGIFHVRGDRGLNSNSSGNARELTASEREIMEYIESFNAKIAHLLNVSPDLADDEIAALGARDPDKIAEDFIEANIQKKTSKKKPFKVVWVCPLSDKKFRDPIFVRKHILNKHIEKVEAAKQDNAVFFNNFLRDPRRPSLPEAPRHMINHYYPPSLGLGGSGGHNPTASGDRSIGSNGNGSYGLRGRNNGPGTGHRPGGFRGGFRNNFGGGAMMPGSGYGGGRGGRAISEYYQDHSVGSGTGGHQAMAAAAAAAAAALYPNTTTADFYALAAAGALGRSGGSGANRGASPRDYQDRNYNNSESYIRKRPYPGGSGGDRHRPGGGGRGVVTYNDLDDPGNDGY